MKTRSSHKWQKKPGTFNSLNLDLIDFDDDYPVIGKSKIVENFNIVSCHDYRSLKDNSFVSMFVDDYILERFWREPERYVDRYLECGMVMSPDFSLLLDMPLPLQMFNTYKNRLIGYYWQSQGINVIPTVSWSDKKSFEFAFNGIEKGSTVCVSNIGCRNLDNKKYFDAGFNELQKKIEPEKIFFQSNKKFQKEKTT